MADLARSAPVEAVKIADQLDNIASRLRYWAAHPRMVAAHPNRVEVIHINAVHNTLTAADHVIFKIHEKIDELELTKKVSMVSKLEQLTETLRPLKLDSFLKVVTIPSTIRHAVKTHVTYVGKELKKDIDAVVASQLTSQQQVGQVQKEMTKRWKDLNNVLRNDHLKVVRKIISDLKSQASLLPLAEPKLANEMPTVAKLISDISSRIIYDLENVDVSRLVPDFAALNLHVDTSSVANDQLSSTWTKQFLVKVKSAIAIMSKSVKLSTINLLQIVSAKQEVERALKNSKEAVANAQAKYNAMITRQRDVVAVVMSIDDQIECCS